MPNGTLSRWSFGLIVLTHLIAFNECGSISVLVASILAMANSLLIVYCKNGLNQIQIPYLRASQRTDFVCLFLALWMELLALVGTCAAIIRTISYCLDTGMSGGLVRIYILGRNSSINEPWPDVIGVVIVFIISFMFIMGLENSKIFTCLMIMGVLLITAILAIITYLRGNVESWLHEERFPKGMQGILSGSALLVISFPNSLTNGVRYPKTKAALLSGSILLSFLLIAACLTTLTTLSKSSDYETVPILKILDMKDLHKLIPAISCIYVIACSGILLEIFPETFAIIVRLASSEWKILLKQIGYESRETGNPALAVFVCGSLIAILTFACPLQNLTFIIAGAQICAGTLRAFFFLYSFYRPKAVNSKQDSTLAYSRLNTGNSNKNVKPVGPKRSTSWFSSFGSQSLSKSITKLNKSGKKEEREWLLLGEPSSPSVRPQNDDEMNAESSILSDTTLSDVDCIGKVDHMDSESSEEEDIDTIVEEFQQKLKVSTTGLKEVNLKIPSSNSWRLALVCIALILACCVGGGYSASNELYMPLALSFGAILLTSVVMLWIPKYVSTYAIPSSFTCIISLFFNSILLAFVTLTSWFAIIFWFMSGIVLVLQSILKCDVWCCLCLDYPTGSAQTTIVMEEHLISHGSSNGIANTSIRMKHAPKGMSVVNHVQSHR